jgi:hypothetical protein
MLRGSLATLGQAGRALKRGTRCRIVVSNALARYALVPFSTAVVGREAEEALAVQVFRGTHGECAEGWRIRVAPARRGEQRIACALDATLLDAIPAAAAEHGLQVTAIEPAWAAGYNAAYRRLPASCWFAVTEPGRLVLGLLIDAEWRQLAAERCGGDARAALRRALQREGTLAEDPAAARLPCWVAHFPFATPTVEALA